MQTRHIRFGAAYYDEYMPQERLATDVAMIAAAGMNTVRIAESTWSTCEPQPGVFDFSHVDRVIDAMEVAGLQVIIGTPTYAVPTWLVQSHPEVLATTSQGSGRYGARQIMNITAPAYLWHAERVIRRLLERTAQREAVIGFQVDNETKYYDTASPDVQRRFVKHLRELFDDDLDAMNRAYGLDYWSNRINAWEDFPDVRGTINGSLAAAWDRFRRGLVTEFLAWQSELVREYARDDQFVTHNLDFDWGPGWSYGLQPAVDHFAVAQTLDVAGVDIYHPTQDELTGKEIAFGGDLARSVKGGANYLVLETQAQGQLGWLPYPGQLRLQALSHIASGADGVMYWHWHSTHNGFETYWKGVLSQDFTPNPTYLEACRLGSEFADAGESLRGITKTNRIGILVSNESLTALQWFGIETGFPASMGPSIGYNDVLRWIYDALFDLNLEVDFLDASASNLADYQMLIVPALYVASQATTDRLGGYVAGGGHLISTFRSFVADEHVKVWDDRAPHGLTEVFGFGYDQFTRPAGVELRLCGELAEGCAQLEGEALAASHFMELLVPHEGSGAEVLAAYGHHAWQNPAITRNLFGAGSATHIATMVSPELLSAVLRLVAAVAGVLDWAQDLSGKVTVRRGHNAAGAEITFLLNYAKDPVAITAPVSGRDVLTGRPIEAGATIAIEGWGALVVQG